MGTYHSGEGRVQLSRSSGRLLLAVAALIAAAVLAAFSLSSPASADSHDRLFGSCSSLDCEREDAPELVNVRGLKAVQISAGSDHVYAVTAQGTLVSWGSAENGRRATPTVMVQRGNTDDHTGNTHLIIQQAAIWSQVAAGNLHTCALTTEGDIHCWGDERNGKTQVPIRLLSQDRGGTLPDPSFAKIAAGGNHTCVLEDEGTTTVTAAGGTTAELPTGSIVCWGDNSSGQTAVPGDPSPERRTMLPAEAASVTGDSGSPDATGIAEAVTGPGEVGEAGQVRMYVDVTAGANHTCAVRDTGIVDCWGSNSHGQINVPIQLRSPQQSLVTPDGQLARSGEFHSIEAGENFTCAINRSGGALCWGSNTGQSGTLGGQEYPPAGEYTQISAGRWHACAISTFDNGPQRGERDATGRLIQAPETATVDGRQIPLSPTGGVDCWGSDLGTGRTTPPAKVSRVTTKGETVDLKVWQWNQVSAGGTFTCGIFSYDPTLPTSPPNSAETASRFSATARVDEGMVECWGLIPNVPVVHTISAATALVPGKGALVCESVPLSEAYLPDGWGRIYGRAHADGAIEFGFMVVQAGPNNDIWRNPNWRWVPRAGTVVVGSWYYSEPLVVQAYDDPAIGARPGQCETQTLSIGRIAVRLLPTGHMELGLLREDGGMAVVPADHARLTNPAEPGKWWASGFVKWRNAN